MTATFLLDGQEFMALNGGPQFKFTEAFRSSSTARRRKKSMSCGRSSQKAAKNGNAAG